MPDVLNGDMLTLAAMMLLTGAAGGVIAGMLGVGGGIVIVPVLDLVLSALGVEADVRMHVTVATSLATILLYRTARAAVRRLRTGRAGKRAPP